MLAVKGRQLWPYVLLWVAAFALYVATAAPTVTLVDSGELILTSATLGVAHPPGFPLYTMTGYLFSKLPVGSVAFRLSLMSGFFAAWVVVLVAWIVGRLVSMESQGIIGLASFKKKKAQKRSGNRSKSKFGDLQEAGDGEPKTIAVVILAGLTMTGSLTLWTYATVAEVYTLNLCLIAACFALLLQWRYVTGERGGVESRRYLLAASLVYGLGLGVHHVSVGLLAPAIAFFLVRSSGSARALLALLRRDAPVAIGCIVLGLSVYLYLPLAARADPLLNWGDPATFEGLWRHVTAQQYQVYLLSVDRQVLVENLFMFWDFLVRQWTPLGLVVAVLGLRRLWQQHRGTFWLLTLVSVVGVLYAIQYDIAEDSDAYFLTSFLALGIAIGMGLWQLYQWLQMQEWLRQRWPNVATWGLVGLSLLPVINLAAHYRENDRHDYYIARHYAEDVLAGVGPGGLVMTLDWQVYAPFLYLHHIENLRPDVIFIDINLVRRSWYLDYLDRVYPQLMSAVERPRDAYRAQLERFERRETYDAEVIQQRFMALLNGMVDHQMKSGEVHMMIPMEPGVGGRYTWIPAGLTFQLFKQPPAQPTAAPDLHFEGLLREPLDSVAEQKVRPLYGTMLAQRSAYLTAQKVFRPARKAVESALLLAPEESVHHVVLGDLERATGNLPAALRAYREALRLDPENAMAQQRAAEASGG